MDERGWSDVDAGRIQIDTFGSRQKVGDSLPHIVLALDVIRRDVWIGTPVDLKYFMTDNSAPFDGSSDLCDSLAQTLQGGFTINTRACDA